MVARAEFPACRSLGSAHPNWYGLVLVHKADLVNPCRVALSLQTSESVMEWLLDPNEPAMQFLASRDLLTRRLSEPALSMLQKNIGYRGWGFAIFARQREKT
jgi:hypothetical protein